MPAELPEWLDEYRISPILSGNAYEATPAPFRAAIKTGIALTWFYFSPKSSDADIRLENRHLGFNSRTVTHPVDWAAIIFPQEFSGASRVAAAATLAAVADVSTIAAFCVEGEPAHPVLASLELCGIEEVFSLQPEKVLAALDEMTAKSSKGSIIMLHDGQLPSLARDIALTYPRFYEEKKSPNIVVCDTNVFPSDLVAFCHGTHACDPELPVDAIFGIYDPDKSQTCIDESAPLFITPGCEGFWLFPYLGLEFFQQSMNVFSLCPQKI